MVSQPIYYIIKGKENTMFVAKVFLNLFFQVLVMYLSAKRSNVVIGNERSFIDLVLYLSKFIILLVIAFVPMPLPIKFALLTVFSALAGAAVRTNKNLENALKETSFIFLVLVVVGIISVQLGIDMRPVGIFLIISLFGLLLFRLFNLTSREDYIKILTVVFAIFVIYDTNNIMQRDYGGDFVDATLDYFQDFSNLVTLQTELDE